jgi:hypothetical protein
LIINIYIILHYYIKKRNLNTSYKKKIKMINDMSKKRYKKLGRKKYTKKIKRIRFSTLIKLQLNKFKPN